MLIVDAPPLEPGHCILTKTSEGPFVDTLVEYDDLAPMGRVYIAKTTVMDMAQMFGATPPEASVRREQRICDLEERLDQAGKDIEGLRTANEALVAAGYQVRPADSDLEPKVPGGSAASVLRWVREVDGPDRAARAGAAIAVERREADPRQSIIDACTKYLEPQGATS